MWKKNNCFFWFLLLFQLGFSQEKKVDTIYVYEEVIIRDTVFIEKPLAKIKIDKIILNKEIKGSKPSITIIQNKQKTIVSADTLIIKRFKNNIFSNIDYSLKLSGGITSNSLLKELELKNQSFLSFGMCIRKRVFNPNYALEKNH
jgi:hypothetical protein